MEEKPVVELKKRLVTPLRHYFSDITKVRAGPQPLAFGDIMNMKAELVHGIKFAGVDMRIGMTNLKT